MNVHGFLYHFTEQNNLVLLRIYDKKSKEFVLEVEERTENLCLLKGVVEASYVYEKRITEDIKLLNFVTRKIFKTKKIEQKKDYMLIFLDKYNEEVLKFNPLVNIEQTFDVVLKEIEQSFNYKIEKEGYIYTLTIYSFEGAEITSISDSILSKLVCIVYSELMGGVNE